MFKLIKRFLGFKRYFIVCYIGNINNGRLTGSIDFIVSGGNHINKDAVKQIENKFNVTDVVITNIIELNKLDFKDYMKVATLDNDTGNLTVK